MSLRSVLARLRDASSPDGPSCPVDPVDLVHQTIRSQEQAAQDLAKSLTEKEQHRLRVQRARAQAVIDQRDLALKDPDWWPV